MLYLFGHPIWSELIELAITDRYDSHNFDMKVIINVVHFTSHIAKFIPLK